MIHKKFISNLVFIDSNVEDYQSLISGVSPNAEVIILDETLDGIEQITERLAIEQNIEAIHIISHGSPGAVQLGSITLNSSNIETFGPQLEQWRKALIPGADILLYGCNVAAIYQPWRIEFAAIQTKSACADYGISTRAGGFSSCSSGFNRPVESATKPTTPNQFLQRLSELTGADIAASANPTGNAALGGDWELEVQIGSIEATPIEALAYSHTLAATANPDNKTIPVNSPQISIDTLANDTGSARVSVQSITTTPTNGTATINDWIYAGGYFTSVNGTARNRIARLNTDGSLDTTFDPGTGMDSDVRAIALDSTGKPVVVGNFNAVNGTARNYIARMNTDGSLDTTFDPGTGMDSSVSALALDSTGKPVVGGDFTFVNGTARNYIARMNTDGSLDTTFNPPGAGMNNTVLELALDSTGKPVVGGLFNAVNGTARNYIARLNTDGSLDTSFDPGAGMDNSVNAIALDSSGKPFVGGIFTTVDGTSRNRIARLNINGSLDTSFDPGAGMDNSVAGITLDSSGKPLVGGTFTTVNGTARNRIARMNTDGSLDASFNPGTGMDDNVNAIALDSGGKLLVGGYFTTVNGTARNRIARMNTDGSLDTSFNPGTGMNSLVNTIALDKGRSI